jgi:MarR family transcriptional regulator, organic hydroperoxide resistance regulator
VNRLRDFLTLEKQLCFAIYSASSEFNKLYTRTLQPIGLTYPQYLVLLALWEREGVTVKELGQKVNLGTGTLTPMIKRMEENGWVKKVRSQADERSVYVYLQEKAFDKKQEITDKITHEIQSCHIDLEEYEQLMFSLKQLQYKLRGRKQEIE